MRRPFVAGNWKMYTNPDSAAELAGKLKALFQHADWADIAVFPPFIAITAVVSTLKGSKIEVGGQNAYWENEGAYTGEVSAAMLKKAGCGLVIIGHSERRTYFGETDAIVALRTKAALANGLRPVVCIGETLEQRESGITETVVENQLTKGLGELADISRLTLAYEPVWAIGTGRNASPDQASEVHEFIRGLVEKRWGKPVAESLRILYGGSVKPENAETLWRKESIDGFLVGGASLKAESFGAIVEAVK